MPDCAAAKLVQGLLDALVPRLFRALYEGVGQPFAARVGRDGLDDSSGTRKPDELRLAAPVARNSARGTAYDQYLHDANYTIKAGRQGAKDVFRPLQTTDYGIIQHPK